MSRNELLMQTKSIMYKIISLGCSVYVDDWDEFLVSVLVCNECGHMWNKSRTECFYCGTENYHVFKCNKCGKLYSITNASQKCNKPNCDGKLSKVCLNPDCISNKDKIINEYLTAEGGVFEIGKSASTLNEMRCKKCGNYASKYITARFKIVNDIKNEETNDDSLYLQKISENKFRYKIKNSEINNCNSIEEIINEVFGFTFDDEFIIK